MTNTVLTATGIDKAFPGVLALGNAGLELHKGEVHALVGANGAGKTTLVKILTRELREDKGEIYLDGTDIRGLSVRQVQDLGLAMVPQAINLVPMFTVGQNIMLGREPVRGVRVSWHSLYKRAGNYIAKITDRVDVRCEVASLSVAEQQLVAVAKALALRPRILVLDEPTASLGDRETREFFAVLRQFKAEGISVLYISHRLKEVFDLAQRVTILRDGHTVGTYPTSELDEERLIRLMIGQTVAAEIAKISVMKGEERLHVSDLSVATRNVRGVSFSVHAGEIVGIVGTLGAGKTEILSAIFGLEPRQKGEVTVDGRTVNPCTPNEAISAGVALVPEERLNALVMDSTVTRNISLASLNKVCAIGGWINTREENRIAADFRKRLSIATPSIHQLVAYLSGGNQQKTVIARWLSAGAKVYLFDESTKGVDVGAKSEIYGLIGELVRNGSAVVYATNEIDEALGLCDRLIVMHRGQMVAELDCRQTNREEILLYMLGGRRSGDERVA